MLSPDYRIYTKPEYYAALLRQIEGLEVGSRVVLATMVFDPAAPQVQALHRQLVGAARRGVSVQLLIDAYSLLIYHGLKLGPLYFHKSLPARLSGPFLAIKDMMSELERAGARCAILNQPGRKFTNPYGGRSHIKYALIDDEVFIGGCNLETDGHIDAMCAWHDENLSQKLYEFTNSLCKDPKVPNVLMAEDITWRLDDKTALFIDAGMRGRSLIYNQALDVIDKAQEQVLITCQYFPNGKTARHLAAAARRGARVEIIYNHPSKHAFPYSWAHHLVTLYERAKMPSGILYNDTVNNDKYLHAKLLLTEQEVMIGSHNYVPAGVMLGTAEIALRSQNSVLIDKARSYVDNMIKNRY